MTTTATSPYRTLQVTIDERGFVRHPNGALLGEKADMERRGWDFTR